MTPLANKNVNYFHLNHFCKAQNDLYGFRSLTSTKKIHHSLYTFQIGVIGGLIGEISFKKSLK